MNSKTEKKRELSLGRRSEAPTRSQTLPARAELEACSRGPRRGPNTTNSEIVICVLSVLGLGLSKWTFYLHLYDPNTILAAVRTQHCARAAALYLPRALHHMWRRSIFRTRGCYASIFRSLLRSSPSYLCGFVHEYTAILCSVAR